MVFSNARLRMCKYMSYTTSEKKSELNDRAIERNQTKHSQASKYACHIFYVLFVSRLLLYDPLSKLH